MSKKSLIKLLIILIAVGLGVLIAWGGSYRGQELNRFSLFGIVVIYSYLLQWLFFVPAVLKGTETFYDLAGGIGFMSATIFLLLATPHVSLLGWILGLMVIIWSARLSTFLFRRVLASKGDDRFDDIKQDRLRFFLTWTLQALWVVATASAAWAGITSSRAINFHWVSVIGIFLWLIGFAFEAVADHQKSVFKAEPSNKGRFISTGLWSLSRHPNYFGEITLWIGVLITAAPVLNGWQWVALLSPLIVSTLLTKVSGIPLLEKKADQRWGGQPDYEAYKETTPVLIPRLGK